MGRNFLEIHSLQNLTTEFELIKNLKARPLEILEYADQGFTFEAAPRICGLGTILHIEGKYYFGGKEFDFLATARLTQSEPLDEGKQSKYTIEFNRFDKTLWENFLESNFQSQADTDRLFQAMRDND